MIHAEVLEESLKANEATAAVQVSWSFIVDFPLQDEILKEIL